MKRSYAFPISILLFILTAVCDFFSGPKLSPALFYLVPVVFSCLYLGAFWGVLASLLGAVLWLLVEWRSAAGDYWATAVPFWNAGIQLCVFLSISAAVIRLQAELRESQRRNKELKKANESILKLSAAKEDFAAVVTHELRTPMAAIKQSLSELEPLAGASHFENYKEFLQIARKNVDRLIRLSDGVLNFSALEKGRRRLYLKTHDLNQLLRESLQLHESLIRNKELDLFCELSAKPLKILCDADALAQVFSNLLGNAVKFTSAGSIRIKTEALGRKAVICFQDTGHGISQAHQDKLFVPFDSFERPEKVRAQQGAGLGLALSKSIVLLHGGEIRIESEEGRGTSVFITLPLSLKEVV